MYTSVALYANYAVVQVYDRIDNKSSSKLHIHSYMLWANIAHTHITI